MMFYQILCFLNNLRIENVNSLFLGQVGKMSNLCHVLREYLIV